MVSNVGHHSCDRLCYIGVEVVVIAEVAGGGAGAVASGRQWWQQVGVIWPMDRASVHYIVGCNPNQAAESLCTKWELYDQLMLITAQMYSQSQFAAIDMTDSPATSCAQEVRA